MTKIQEKIQHLTSSLESKVKAYREHIHQFPELSYQEIETVAFVKESLERIGITNVKSKAKTGLEALITNPSNPNPTTCIALRADLDALPILEENEVPYKSKRDGLMHACGHDVHTAILLGVAEILHELRAELPQAVKLIFQPGEEKNPGGASLMIEDGVLENPSVTKMFALHVFPELEAGKLGFKEGMYMASCDEIYITINGKGGHGALPQNCIDPIFIGATFITSIQQIISRKCDPKIPSVLTFGHFEGIGATNVIPSKVYLKGTFRTMDENWRKIALLEIEKQAKGIAESLGGTADIEISKGYPYLINDEQLTRDLKSKSSAYFSSENVVDLPIRLTSEDFAFYSHHVPVCFFRLGVRNESKGIIHGVHHPKFNIDERALKIGMEAMLLAIF